MNLGAAFDTPPRLLYDQRPEEMFTASGQNFTVTGTIAEPSRPFRVTLAWTDAPGSTTGPAFNNDLDLTVTVGGQVYKGNVFSGALSTTGGAADMRNNRGERPSPRWDDRGFHRLGQRLQHQLGRCSQHWRQPGAGFRPRRRNGDEIPRPAIVAAGATLIAEECGVGNGVLDPVRVSRSISDSPTWGFSIPASSSQRSRRPVASHRRAGRKVMESSRSGRRLFLDRSLSLRRVSAEET